MLPTRLAYTKGKLKDDLETLLTGALYQHYLLMLLAQTTQTYLYDHWVDKKYARLNSAAQALRHQATIGKRAKWVALQEVKALVQANDAAVQGQAWQHFNAVYATKLDTTVLILTADHTTAFWREVKAMADNALA